MAGKNRVDTNALFAGMIGADQEKEPEKETTRKKPVASAKTSGKKRRLQGVDDVTGEPTYQYGYYVTEQQDKALAILAIERGKNKSALVREAINLLLEKEGRV